MTALIRRLWEDALEGRRVGCHQVEHKGMLAIQVTLTLPPSHAPHDPHFELAPHRWAGQTAVAEGEATLSTVAPEGTPKLAQIV